MADNVTLLSRIRDPFITLKFESTTIYFRKENVSWFAITDLADSLSRVQLHFLTSQDPVDMILSLDDLTSLLQELFSDESQETPIDNTVPYFSTHNGHGDPSPFKRY